MSLTLRQLFDDTKQILPWSDPLNKDACLKVFGWSLEGWSFGHWRALINVCYIFRVRRLSLAKGEGDNELSDLLNFSRYRGLYDTLEIPGQNGSMRLADNLRPIFLYDLEIVETCAVNFSLPRGLKILLNKSRAKKLNVYLHYHMLKHENQLENILDHVRRSELLKRNHSLISFSAFTWDGEPVWPERLTDPTKFDSVRTTLIRNKKRASCLQAIIALLGLKRLGWREIDRDTMSIVVGILWSTKEEVEW